MPPALLKQKLTPPAPWAEAIARPRLLARLDELVDTGHHVGLFAGTGHGKTALLSAWAQTRPVAWLTLDAEDADLDVALAYLIAAFEAALPDFKTEAHGLLGRARERQGAFATLSALLADLDEQLAKPLVLVIDDYHLAASPSLDALVARMLRYLPAQVRLVLAARKPPAVEAASLQARGALAVLDEPALAFDPAELRLLRPDHTPAELDALHQATGGWPAAMGLTPELLDAYLEEQVLAGLEPATIAFLTRVALVEAFDAPLCEEALGEPLTRERRGLLLAERLAFPRGRDRYVLQPALRAYLVRRFQAEVPRGERQALQRRIADYHWRNGQPATALRHLVAAGDAAEAAGRLAGVAEAWLADGRLDALSNALAVLGPAAEAPGLVWLAAELRRRWGELEEAGRLYQRALAGAAEPETRARARLGLAQVAASRGDVAAARTWLADLGPAGVPEQALSPGDPGVALAIDAAILEGGMALLEGRTEVAIARFEAALALARRVGDAYGEARAIHNLGICCIRVGDFARALGLYDRAAALAAADGTPLVWMSPINRALVLVHLGRPDEAAEAAEAALALVRRYHLTREEGYALRILGFAHMRRGALEPAGSSFRSAELLAGRTSDALGVAYSQNFLAELALLRGDVAGAEALAEQIAASMGGPDAVSGILDFAQVRAKISLAAGRTEEARERLEALLARARATGHVNVAEETLALQAEGAPAPTPVPAQAPAPELSIRTFGGLRAARPDGAIGDKEWQTARAKQLLAFLVFTPEGATKETLLEHVFPNEAVSNDLMNMTMMRVRKALEPGLEKGQPSRFILRADGRYQLNREAHVAVDVDAFEAALRDARPGMAGERAALERAIAAYGGTFLPEIEAPWAVAIRLRLQDQAIGACRRLLALLDGEPAAAEALLDRALAIDPLNEELNRELILRHLEAGEPQRALAHYQLCDARWRQLSGQPAPADLAALVGAR